jgi:hypothetical protein
VPRSHPHLHPARLRSLVELIDEACATDPGPVSGQVVDACRSALGRGNYS